MVKRIFLDEESVEAAEVPATGDSWISDTKVKGFGLRLYNSTSGPIKRFCVRTVDKDGKPVRKTFNDGFARYEHYQSCLTLSWLDELREDFDWLQPLGRYAQSARTWAANEILLLKGIPTLETENEEQAKRVKEKLADVTLTRCVEAVLNNYRKMKLTTAYIDRVEKIYVTTVPRNLQTKLMREISKEDAQQILLSVNPLRGNRRTLIPFLSRVFSVYASLAHEKNQFWSATNNQRRNPLETTERFQIDEEKLEKIRHLISFLESEESSWQQSLCLRLYLSSHCPLSRLMAARWDELYEVTYAGAKNHRLQWRHASNIFRHEIYSKRDERLIERIYEKVSTEFLDNPYWFPSKLGRKVGHIRTADPTWIKALSLVGLSYVTPREMRSAIAEYGHWWIWPDSMQDFWGS